MAGYLAGDVDEWIYIDIADQHLDSMADFFLVGFGIRLLLMQVVVHLQVASFLWQEKLGRS